MVVYDDHTAFIRLATMRWIQLINFFEFQKSKHEVDSGHPLMILDYKNFEVTLHKKTN